MVDVEGSREESVRAPVRVDGAVERVPTALRDVALDVAELEVQECDGNVVGALGLHCGGCGGCDSEVYWSEWHNDPPRCQDPFDKCANWIGPSPGYREPYQGDFAPRRTAAHGAMIR